MNINHIIKTIKSDLKPIKVFNGIKDKRNCFILDSIDGSNGTMSLIGYEPFLTLKSSNGEVVEESNGKERILQGNPFEILKNYLFKYSITNAPYTNIPFGGAVGYLGYTMGHLADYDGVPSNADYDFHMGFYDSFMIYDHVKSEYLLLTISFKNASTLLDERMVEMEKILTKIEEPADLLSLEMNNGKIERLINKAEYKDKVLKIKEYIAAGDIYQANFTQQFKIKIENKAFEIYENLRKLSPVPYAAYMECNGKTIISLSPEQFLKIKGKKVQTRPIKGTRSRGDTEEGDKVMAQELLTSEKDNAELLMIVDLERNDLGRVCKYNSIKVEELKRLETYTNVHHLAATISGILRDEKDHVDCIRACFPGGSITGAPKIRSMEIIEELENEKRGVYCGAIGYIGFNECTELNIAIRTAEVNMGELTFYAGGGIVADSDPEQEYEESLVKVKSFFEAVSGIKV